MTTSKFKCDKCGAEWPLVHGKAKDLTICNVRLSVTTESEYYSSYRSNSRMELHSCDQDWCRDCVNKHLVNVPHSEQPTTETAIAPTFEAQIIALLQGLGVKFEE